MNTVTKILAGFFIGVIIFQFVFHSCEERKWNKSERTLNAIIDSCYNKPPDTITKVITLKQIDTIRLKPEKITISDSILVHDTVLYTKSFTGKYEVDDYLSIRWKAVVLGELKSFEILPYSFLRYPQVTITKTVALPAKECKDVIVKRERSHLYFLADASFYPSFGSFGTGLMYIRKEGWGLTAKMYVTDKIGVGGGLIIRIK